MVPPRPRSLLFFFNDTATTEIYTLSLHDALPISQSVRHQFHPTGAIPETILRPTPAPLSLSPAAPAATARSRSHVRTPPHRVHSPSAAFPKTSALRPQTPDTAPPPNTSTYASPLSPA